MFRINYYIKALDKEVPYLQECIKNISNTQYPLSFISIMSSKESLSSVIDILNKNQLGSSKNNLFNKMPFGIPTCCFGYGEGAISLKDSLSFILRQTIEYTDIYVVLDYNDLIHINYPYEIINAFNQAPIVKIVYSDHICDGKRIYSDPCVKNLFLTDKIQLQQFAFKSDVLTNDNIEVDEHNLVKNILNNNFMAIQKIEPLYTKKI